MLPDQEQTNQIQYWARFGALPWLFKVRYCMKVMCGWDVLHSNLIISVIGVEEQRPNWMERASWSNIRHVLCTISKFVIEGAGKRSISSPALHQWISGSIPSPSTYVHLVSRPNLLLQVSLGTPIFLLHLKLTKNL